MSTSFGDKKTAQLRTLVGTIERELGRSTDSASSELRSLFTSLVTTLALGPAPETRTCPACGGTGMRAASRCAHCWAALAPLPAAEA